jgi:hypothetical protein
MYWILLLPNGQILPVCVFTVHHNLLESQPQPFLNFICMSKRNTKSHDWTFHLSWYDCKWVGLVLFFGVYVLIFITFVLSLSLFLPLSLSLSLCLSLSLIKKKTLQKVIPQRQNMPSGPSPKDIFPKLLNSLTSIAIYYIFPCRITKVRMFWVHALKLDSLIPMIRDTTSVKQVTECKRLILRAFF